MFQAKIIQNSMSKVLDALCMKPN